MNEYKAIVGTVSWADTGETMTFTDANEYLECIKENIEYMGIIGFKFRTLTRDPAVRKAVDDSCTCDYKWRTRQYGGGNHCHYQEPLPCSQSIDAGRIKVHI